MFVASRSVVRSRPTCTTKRSVFAWQSLHLLLRLCHCGVVELDQDGDPDRYGEIVLSPQIWHGTHPVSRDLGNEGVFHPSGKSAIFLPQIELTLKIRGRW